VLYVDKKIILFIFNCGFWKKGSINLTIK